MIYENGPLKLISDYPIKAKDQGQGDIDLSIPLDDRVVNLNLPDLPAYVQGRLQFPQLGAVLIRFNPIIGPSLASIHLMEETGGLALMNFVVSYETLYFEIKDRKSHMDFNLVKK